MTNQSTTTKEALEPCPFCGSTSVVWSEHFRRVRCNGCFIGTAPLGDTNFGADALAKLKASSVEAWNSRVSAPIVAPVVDERSIDARLDRSYIAGAKFGWNCAEEGAAGLDQFQAAIRGRYDDIHAAPASTVAPQQSDGNTRALQNKYDEGWYDAITAIKTFGLEQVEAMEPAPASPAALRDEAERPRGIFDAGFAATTPPSTLAKAAAEEIVAELDRRAWLFDSHGARPIASGKAAYMEQVVAAIIERCLAGGGESGQSDAS